MDKKDMRCNPYFSIIVPVYNVEKYLKECLGSILEQEFKDYELLLIDDGSTDKSGSVCDKIQASDSRVKVVHQENRGVGAARNTGIRLAKGKWIVFVDSDDCLSVNSLQLWKDAVQEAPNQQLLVAQYELMDEKGKAFIPDIPHQKGFQSGVYSTTDYEKEVVRYQRTADWAVWKLLVRTQLLQNNKLFFCEEIGVAEDEYWVLKLLLAVPEISYTNRTVYRYRYRRTGGLTSNILEDMECVGMLDAILARELCGENRKHLQFIHALLGNQFIADYINTAVGCSDTTRREKIVMKYPQMMKGLSRSIVDQKRRLLAKFCCSFGIKKTDDVIALLSFLRAKK